MGMRPAAPAWLANLRRCREPVHSRHAQIHQYEIEALRSVACNSFRSVVDPYGSASENSQIALSNLCIDGLVFDQENMAAEIRLVRCQYRCDVGPGGHCFGGDRQRLIQGPRAEPA